MSLGKCHYLTCDSMLGSAFRAPFKRLDNGGVMKEILICPRHIGLCEYMRDGSGQLNITAEGWVYTTPWMETLYG